MLSKVDPLYFILAFAVGLLYCYISHPTPDVVVKFPSPYNADVVTYKDEQTNSCYKYKADKVTCPRDRGLIKVQPVL